MTLTEKTVATWFLRRALQHMRETDVDTFNAHRIIVWALALIETGKARRPRLVSKI